MTKFSGMLSTIKKQMGKWKKGINLAAQRRDLSDPTDNLIRSSLPYPFSFALAAVLIGELGAAIAPPVALAQASSGESPLLFQPLSQNDQPPKTPRNNPAPFETAGGSRWRDAFRNNQPPESGDGGSRGGPLCPLTPLDAATGVQVFSDRPTLAWRGQLVRVELYVHNTDRVIWSQDLGAEAQKVSYTGEPLKPGLTYDLMLYETQPDAFPLPSKMVTFTVVGDGEMRREVAEKLEKLQAELEGQGASPEEIAFGRFNYLVEKRLWSDALAEAFSVENPADELREFRQKTVPEHFCN